jgi:asparagine synthase (glutamine-hydrolysing)
MSSLDKTLWIEFNGEIYNYLDIKNELISKGYKFKSTADTEVILYAYKEWGYDCLNKFNGMWAFAIWDDNKKQLFCARDRFGDKPFYYYKDENKFVFASEIKSILVDNNIERRLNTPLVYACFILNLINHTKETLFKNIYSLPPSNYLVLSKDSFEIKNYYKLNYNDDFTHYDDKQLNKYATELKELLFDAVKIRLGSDVPIGSSLSGGIDSSSIVCIYDELLSRDLDSNVTTDKKQKTFSAVYHDETVSEKKHIEKILKKIDAEYHYIYPNMNDFNDEVNNLIYQQDEPFLSTSMYAQWNVMKLTKQNNVKVLLDGQGADEIFAGYEWHLPIYHAELVKRGKIGKYINEIKKISSLRNRSITQTGIKSIVKIGASITPHYLKMLDKPQIQIFNHDFITKYKDRETAFKKSNTNLQKRLFEEQTGYNLQQLLRYGDRNSMGHSIETRLPFVDHRIVEFALSVPSVYKIYNGWSKYILRYAMKEILPESITWRKDKVGYATPEQSWVKNIDFNSLFNNLSKKDLFEEIFIQKNELYNKVININNHNLKWRFFNFTSWLELYNIL